MADVYSAIILDDDYWDGTVSWAGELSQANRDTKYSTRRYTTIQAWDTARDGASSSGDTEYGVIIGPWATPDTTNVTIAGWNALDLVLECPITLPDGDNAARHNGIYGDKTNAFLISESGNEYNIKVNDGTANNTMIIDGLQCHMNNNKSCITWYSWDSTSVGTTKNCICYSEYGASGAYDSGITMVEPGTYYAYNNICFGWLGGNCQGISMGVDDPYIYVYNNTCYNNRHGIKNFSSANAAQYVRNNACFNNTDDFYGVGSADELTHNASDDGDGTNEVDWDLEATDWNANFEDYTTYDVTPLDQDLPDAGIGPSSDSNVPTDDIMGNTRSGTTCTIGAWEFVEAGAGWSNIAEVNSTGQADIAEINGTAKADIAEINGTAV